MFVVFDWFFIGVLLSFATAIGLYAVDIIRGAMGIIAIVILVVEVIVSIKYYRKKIDHAKRDGKSVSKEGWISVISSGLCFYTSAVVLSSLCQCDSSFEFIMEVLVCGTLFFYALSGWLSVNSEDEVITGLLKEAVCAGILFIVSLI